MKSKLIMIFFLSTVVQLSDNRFAELLFYWNKKIARKLSGDFVFE